MSGGFSLTPTNAMAWGQFAPAMAGIGSGMGTSAPIIDAPRITMAPSDLSGLSTMGNIPDLGAAAGGGIGNGLGFNIPTAQLAMSGLATIGNLWAAFNAQKMAKKQFQFTKGLSETNLRNSAQAYNTSLEDRISSRAVVNGLSAEQAKAYLDRNRLSGTIGK